jgi:ribose transport system permease protein
MNRKLEWSRQGIGNFIAFYGFYLFMIISVILIGTLSDKFFTLKNFINIVLDAAPYLVLAVGMGLCLLAGKYDLSVGSLMMVTATIFNVLVRSGMPFWPAVLITLVAGVSLGMINGFLVAILRLDSIVTTLGMMFFFRGVGYYYSNNRMLPAPDEIAEYANASIFSIPNLVWFAVILLLLAQLALSRTTFGSHIVAIGSSEQSARLVGIPVTKIFFLLFVISGICGSIAGIISVLNVGATTPRTGQSYEFVVITMLVLGGMNLFGGRGSIIPGALLGVLLLVIFQNGLLLLSSDPYFFRPMRGVIMLIAALTYAYRDRIELAGRRLIVSLGGK